MYVEVGSNFSDGKHAQYDDISPVRQNIWA